MRLPQKLLVLGGLIILTPLLLCSLGLLLLLINSVNPIQITYLTRFRVENLTTRPLWLTPVGTFDSGRKSVLPLFARRLPAIPAFWTKNIRIDPGGRTWIIYHCSCSNGSGLVVLDAEGEFRQLIVDPDPSKRDRFKQERYIIENWETLPRAAVSVLAVARAPDRRWWRWAIFATGFIVMPLYIWMLRHYRRLA